MRTALLLIALSASIIMSCHNEYAPPSIVKMKYQSRLRFENFNSEGLESYIIYNAPEHYDSLLTLINEFNRKTIKYDTLRKNYDKYLRLFFIPKGEIDSVYKEDEGFIPDRLTYHRDAWLCTFLWQRCFHDKSLDNDTIGIMKIEAGPVYEGQDDFVISSNCKNGR